MKTPVIRIAGLTMLATATATVATPAAADGTLVWQQKDGHRVVQEYRAPNHVRMTSDDGSQGYALFDGAHMYTVTKSDGAWHVYDVNQAMQSLGASTRKPATKDRVKPENFSVHDLHRRETIAGLTGEVYRIDTRDSGGKVQSSEVVITDNRALYRLETAINQSMMRGLGASNSEVVKYDFAAMARTHGMPPHPAYLRYGGMQLTSYSQRTPAASRFNLPAKPERIQMPNVSATLSAAPGEAPASQQQQNSGSGLGKLVSGKTDREENRQKQRVNDRVDQETDKATDKVIDKALDKLFGGG